MAVTREPRLTIYHARTRAVIKSTGLITVLKTFYGTLFRITRGHNRELLVSEAPS
jgi:hypothetical protein